MNKYIRLLAQLGGSALAAIVADGSLMQILAGRTLDLGSGHLSDGQGKIPRPRPPRETRRTVVVSCRPKTS